MATTSNLTRKKTKAEITHAVELLAADVKRLRKQGKYDVAAKRDAMLFALEWTLGKQRGMDQLLALLALIEKRSKESS